MPWIEWIDGDTGAGHTQLRERPPSLLRDMLGELVQHYKRYVEIEAFGDGYTVKVVPAFPGDNPVPLSVGLSYSGMNLQSILAQAEQDVFDLKWGQLSYRVTNREHTRWVP